MFRIVIAWMTKNGPQADFFPGTSLEDLWAAYRKASLVRHHVRVCDVFCFSAQEPFPLALAIEMIVKEEKERANDYE